MNDSMHVFFHKTHFFWVGTTFLMKKRKILMLFMNALPDRPTDRPTNRPTNHPINGHNLLQRCEDASKNCEFFYNNPYHLMKLYVEGRVRKIKDLEQISWQFDWSVRSTKKVEKLFDRGIVLNDSFLKSKFVPDRHLFFIIDATSIRSGNHLTKKSRYSLVVEVTYANP